MNKKEDKIKVLLIDDSVIVLNSLLKILEKDEQIEIVGMAKDGEEGVLKAIELNPDVITLDINMPKMDGRFCLQHIMEKCPTPCIILSKATQLGALESLELLELGAVDFIGKPSRKEIDRNISLVANLIIKKIKQAKSIELKKLLKQTNHDHVEVDKKKFSYEKDEYEGIVTIGSSTGGPQTLSNIISHFPENFPYPIIIAQHIPENFSKALAERLNRLSHLHVKEAENREIIKKGIVYVSPGGKNILIKKVNNNFVIKIVSSKDDLNLPSIDKLFMSASECFGKKSVGIILTGMGEDGSHGLKLIKDSGGVTLAQSPNEAVIGGMPSAAKRKVPNCFVMDSEKIIPFLVSFIEG
ncbi:chemotaxis-specific protein-glutamate methyltransferase CheB [Bacteriovoracales bacterium]|nr:chemotaxis-specific protein-glutamate methyltransferase CheB [Bacteriovoracales bacterium]